MPANDATFPIRNRFNEPQLVARQDNTIQFDLQKIAAEFQVKKLLISLWFLCFWDCLKICLLEVCG